jgi:peptide/nickel transport system permease protein
MIPVLLIVAVIAFMIIHLIPGDPASVMLGEEATPQEVQALRDELGLNLPIYEQFVQWFAGIFQGDFGNSIYMNMPVLEAFLGHIGPTLSLALLAQSISIIIAIPIGVIAAKRRGTYVDQMFMTIAMLGLSLPSFLLALLLMLLFGVNLNCPSQFGIMESSSVHDSSCHFPGGHSSGCHFSYEPFIHD